ncbi:acyl-CoA carboxylase epsilon subunit [Agromyces salentinus]|uniref:Acyl-CoA carboxylase subunit epsilon n=1 Tax=Agromyces salentinus TaxID=269421 RepID=A0ABN2MWL1_9MICO|nr:acyl-CoA carboxylase epsilon subunit [Agromyces salentinus]
MSTRDESTPEADAAAAAAAIRFITRNVTDEEAAAVTAVLVAALEEQSDATVPADPRRGAWVRSSGSLSAFDPRGARWDRAGA